MRLLREPVVHFALLGLVFFVWFKWTDDTQSVPRPTDQIIVSEAEMRQLIDQHKSVWRRQPTNAELSGLIDQFVRQEILVREALALGLDRDDAIIRSRLSQKMQFLTASATQALEPSDDVLRAHISDNADRFSRPAQVAFEHVYLGERSDDAVVAGVRARLEAGEDPTTLGKRSLLPSRVTLASQSQIDSAFGTGFFAALEGSEPDKWVGPLRSGYGYHLARINQIETAAPLEFASIREKALIDWRQVQSKALVDAHIAALRETYDVVVPTPDQIQDSLGQ